MTTTAAKYARLTAAMEDRRLELNLSWTDVAERGGPSVSRLGVIRRGATPNISPLTRARIARALEWDRKYVDALLADGPLPDPAPAPADLIAEDSYEEAVLASPKASPALKRAAIEYHRAGGREAMAKLGFFPRRLDKARYGG